MSPTQRTLKMMRERGAVIEVVERWNPHSRTRHDLFNFIDAVALHGNRIIGVQTTSGSNVAARVAKILECQAFPQWLASGGLVEVHGWAKRGARGKRKAWTCRRVGVTVDGVIELV